MRTHRHPPRCVEATSALHHTRRSTMGQRATSVDSSAAIEDMLFDNDNKGIPSATADPAQVLSRTTPVSIASVDEEPNIQYSGILLGDVRDAALGEKEFQVFGMLQADVRCCAWMQSAPGLTCITEGCYYRTPRSAGQVGFPQTEEHSSGGTSPEKLGCVTSCCLNRYILRLPLADDSGSRW